MMNIKRSMAFFLLLLLFIPALGCGPVISPKVMAKVDSSIAFGAVLQNPDAYKGRTVLWGGKIIQVLPQNGTTYVEVLKMTFGWREKPEEAYAPEGKFLILFRNMPDFSNFDRGLKITVAGEIQGGVKGVAVGSLTEKDYPYPVILSEEFHLWKDRVYPYSSPEPYVGPWWYESPSSGLRF